MGQSDKIKRIVIRFDSDTYAQISEYAEIEHKDLGEFVRYATLYYIKRFGKSMKRQALKSKKLDDLLKNRGDYND